VSVTATDPNHTVAQTRCVLDPATPPVSFDDLPNAPCSLTSVSADGQHTIYAASIDTSGNKGSVESVSFKIDQTPPTVTLTTPTDGAHYSVVLSLLFPVHANYTCADSASGTASCTGTLPNGARIPTGIGDIGTHKFTVIAKDNAGNTTTVTHTYTVGLL
jgi:hypothetical protein